MNFRHIKAFLVIGALCCLLGLVIVGLGDAIVPLILAFALSYILFPLISWLEKRRIKRTIAVAAVFLTLTLGLALVILLVVPGLVSDTKEFLHELPQNASKSVDKVTQLAAEIGFELDLSREGMIELLSQGLSSVSAGMINSALSLTKSAFSGIASVILGVLNLFLAPLFFFYVINDYEKILLEVKSFVPSKLRPILSRYALLSNRVLNGYIRGQMIVAALLGLLYGIGLSLVGLRFGFLIGILSGLISIIPYAGFTIGFAVAIMMALANFTGTGSLLGVCAVFIVVQSLEGLVITPKLVGDKVGLSAFTTMLALIVGGNLLGLTGMLLAIPLAAILKEAAGDLKQQYLSLDWVAVSNKPQVPIPAQPAPPRI